MFCHECEDEWFRDEHGLTCPRCQSDFVEVIEANNNPHDFHTEHDDDLWAPSGAPTPPGAMNPFNNHMGPFGFPFSNFASPQPANRAGGPEYHRAEYRTPGGGLVVSSFTYSSGSASSSTTPQQAHPQSQVFNSLGGMLQGLLGNIMTNNRNTTASPPPGSPPPGMQSPFLHPRNANAPQQPQQVVDPLPNIMAQFFPPQQPGMRSPGSPPPGFHDDGDMPTNLMGMMRMILSGHPMLMGGHGDAAYSQEEFDRIMSQLLEQAQQGGGEPPASQEEIARIPKLTVDQAWLDKQENKDCSICMEEAKLGDEISELWCGHWYHPFCIKQWLDAHGACPLCRKTLRQSREEWEKNEKSARRERRRSSRPNAGSRTHSSSQDWHGYRNESGNSGGSGSGGDGSASQGGIRDRLSSLFSRTR